MCTSYKEAINALRNWYRNTDNRARILTKWQSLKFSEEFIDHPDHSEKDVFRRFVAQVMSLQKHLDASFYDDKRLRDRLMTAVDIPWIETSLRDQVSRTAHQMSKRIANQHSDRRKEAGI